MGKLRIEPKQKSPGFIRLQVEPDKAAQMPEYPKPETREASIKLVTKHGTALHLSRDISLKQVARLVRMLDGRWP
ncbi:hypothetical protein [Acanthopleuribacter pedis]